jgi:hypothetical protein
MKLGEAFKHTVSNSESICEEIKNELREEITQGLISTRDIERYCPIEWKKKTRPKKEAKNDKLSFSRQVQHVIPPILVDTHGNSVTEPAPIPDPDSINDGINREASAREEAKCTDECPIHNELEEVIRKPTSFTNADQQLSEQGRVKELETKIGRLEVAQPSLALLVVVELL